jgi:hypothetical protein
MNQSAGGLSDKNKLINTPKASEGFNTSKSKMSARKPFSPISVGGIQLGIDFTFNTIKNVQKVNY